MREDQHHLQQHRLHHRSKVLKFDNHFWNEEIGNFEGWEVVLRKLKDGRQILKEYSDFLKQRALMEENLGKSLVKLAKSINIKEDYEPLRGLWEVLKTQTEFSGLSHLKASHQLLAESVKVAELNDAFREKRKLREDAVKGHQQNLKVNWKKMSDAKRSYELRCRDEVTNNQFYHQEASRLGIASREAEKAHSKYIKSKQLLDHVESQYQSCVSSVEEIRNAWEKETERTFLSFQCLEEDRLTMTRDSLWRVTNVISQTAVEDDHSAEEMRKMLEMCDLDEALNRFITDNATGQKRPESIIFTQQPTSSSLGMGRASNSIQYVRPSGPGSGPVPGKTHQSSCDLQAPLVQGSVSLSSLRDLAVSGLDRNWDTTFRCSRPRYSTPTIDPPPAFLHSSHMSLVTSPEMIPYNVASSNPALQYDSDAASPPGPPPARPRKPPRLFQYPGFLPPANRNALIHRQNYAYLDAVENGEYFSLPDELTPSSSEYHSDLSSGVDTLTTAGDSGIFFSRATCLSQNNMNSSLAMVVYDNAKLEGGSPGTKSHVVQILGKKHGSDWVKVRDEYGREGYYPSNYLRRI